MFASQLGRHFFDSECLLSWKSKLRISHINRSNCGSFYNEAIVILHKNNASFECSTVSTKDCFLMQDQTSSK
ncbi:hypothetical protein CW304_19660 [Bacillus sp. UFRGS-B20]|nr:hypothetical protein CW304_19660 [Bacillus sp. UFRGS-B20]